MTTQKPSHLKLVYSSDKPKPPSHSQAKYRRIDMGEDAWDLTPLEEFDGLAPLQMRELLMQPFNNPLSPIAIMPVTEGMFTSSPIAQALAVSLQFFAKEKGEKLTAQVSFSEDGCTERQKPTAL